MYCHQYLEFSGVLYKLYKDQSKSLDSQLHKKPGIHVVGIVKQIKQDKTKS